MHKKRVLWVDDDSWNTDTYQLALQEKGFEVVFLTDVDEAMALLKDKGFNFDLVIWDLSLPPGNSFRKEPNDGGTTTGSHFFRAVKDRSPKTPTLLFTNFKALVPDWNRPALREFAFAKRDYLPDEFASAVRGLLY